MKKASITLLAMGILIWACKHEIPQDSNGNGNGNGNTDTTTVYVNPHPCDPDTVYFVNDILPFITSNCAMSGCHDANGSGEADPYTTYSQINWNRSDIYQEMAGGSMPPWSSGINLTAAQIQMFQKWVQQGHLNNECIPDCDPNAAVTFSGTISPIIQTNCQGCHSGSSPSGGVSLTNYSNISNAALNGNLIDCLSGANGISIMPPSSGGLPECIIGQFQTWKDAGAPNN